MQKDGLQRFSEIHKLPPEILQGIEQVAANTLEECKNLTPLKVNLPSIEELTKRKRPTHVGGD